MFPSVQITNEESLSQKIHLSQYLNVKVHHHCTFNHSRECVSINLVSVKRHRYVMLRSRNVHFLYVTTAALENIIHTVYLKCFQMCPRYKPRSKICTDTICEDTVTPRTPRPRRPDLNLKLTLDPKPTSLTALWSRSRIHQRGLSTTVSGWKCAHTAIEVETVEENWILWTCRTWLCLTDFYRPHPSSEPGWKSTRENVAGEISDSLPGGGGGVQTWWSRGEETIRTQNLCLSGTYRTFSVSPVERTANTLQNQTRTYCDDCRTGQSSSESG